MNTGIVNANRASAEAMSMLLMPRPAKNHGWVASPQKGEKQQAHQRHHGEALPDMPMAEVPEFIMQAPPRFRMARVFSSRGVEKTIRLLAPNPVK